MSTSGPTVASDQRQEIGTLNSLNNGSEIWGNIITNKSNQDYRIAFQNINGFGYSTDNFKGEALREFINSNEVDIMLMAEINTNWRLVGKRNTIWDITRGWFENQSVSCSYNKHDRRCSLHQPGGTATIHIGETALRVIKTGEDQKKLGRWNWSLLRGKNNVKLRMISCYVPHTATEHGAKKIFCQQHKALLQMGIKEGVAETYWNDFWQDIDSWLEAGEQLIICGDWNVDVRSKNFLRPFRERNLIPSITNKHGNSGPGTHNRGSDPIDEIFISQTLQVTKAGYLAHGEGIGDHRAIWIDITKASALGEKLPELPSYRARRLKCHDPRTVKRYNKLLEDYLRKYGVFDRIYDLSSRVTNPLTEKDIVELEKLDKIREKCMLLSEAKCRKLKMGGVHWSPILQQARNLIEYYTLSLSRKRGAKVGARYLCRLSKKVDVDASNFSITKLEEKVNEAHSQYKAVKKKHVELRQTFLENLADAQEEAGQGKKATLLRNLMALEMQRNLFRKLRRLRKGPANNLSTTSVTVRNIDGTTSDILDKEAIEEAIIDANRQKYHQTEQSCPFFSKELRSDFGDFGEGPAMQAVLEGTYKISPSIDQYTADYIMACQSLPRKPAPFLRSPLDFKNSWKKMNEKTSSRRLHFGHFKAACQNDLNMMVHYTLAEIPFRTGYSLERWKKATTVMILKEEGNYAIEKLRTIVLFEADFNHNNKFFGRQMMHHAIDNHFLAKEQYSIPGRKSIDHALNRRLLFDIVRYQKTSAAMTSCDLLSCYDRIAHTPAVMAMASYETPLEPAISMFKTYQETQFVTRTAYGDSEHTFGGKEEGFIAAPQGSGQGNGAGPPIWAVVSSKMFEVMHNRGIIATYTSPISKNSLETCGFAFVDDTDIIATSGYDNNPTDTMEKMQTAIDCWEGLAKTTGGAISTDKSWWYLIHFEWKDGDWSYGNLEDFIQPTLTSLDKNNCRQILQHVKSDEAKKMLGVHIAPDGNERQQLKIMKEQATKLGEMARTGYIQTHEAWIALNAVALKSIEYPLPALILSQSDHKTIMTPILNAFLPALGINRKFKRDVLYGPLEFQGLNIQNPFLTQGIHHITDIVDHSWQQTPTGAFIATSLEHLRLELGQNIPILETAMDTYSPYLLNESWIVAAWKFMSNHHVKIKDHTPKILPAREGDQEIMKVVNDSNLNPADKKTCNKCRMFLQVFWLSDITSGNGKFITQHALDGIQNPEQSSNEAIWPLWGNPKTSQWTTWKRVIKTLFCSGSILGKLTIPLGKWTKFRYDRWKWFTDTQQSVLYQRDSNSTWYSHQKIGTLRRSPRFEWTSNRVKAPNQSSLLPTTVRLNYPYIQSEGTCTINPVSTPNPSITKTHLSWLHYKVTSTSSISKLLRDICKGTAIAVTDGSYFPSLIQGTAGWTIESSDGTEYITGISVVPGPEEIQNPYRSETTGVLAILEKLYQLCTNYRLLAGGITLGCDCISALRQGININKARVSCKKLHNDLLSAGTSILQLLPLKIHPVHVRGHQDSKESFSNLSRLAQMNVRMDYLAKEALITLEDKAFMFQDKFEPHPFSTQIIWYKDEIIHHNTAKSLYKKIMGEKLKHYWIERGRLSHFQWNLISWTAQRKAMQQVNINRRIFVVKWCTRNFGTGKNVKRWQYRHSSNCPFCLAEEECVEHILHCLHPDAVSAWNDNLFLFCKAMAKLGTPISIVIAIKRELDAWRNYNSFPPITYLDEDTQQAIITQRIVGWNNFLEGLWVEEWLPLMEAHFDDIQSRRSELLWASRGIRLAWDLISATWKARNQQLHETDRIKQLSGLPHLITAIKLEWDIGLGTLPAIDFSHLFKLPLPQLLQKTSDTLIDWFSVIRTGRILHEDPNLPRDIFYSNQALCRWVGIDNLKKVHKQQKKQTQSERPYDSDDDSDSSVTTSGSSSSSTV